MTSQGHFGPYGGQYVAETLMAPLHDLAEAYASAKKDPAFQKECRDILRDYVGRESPIAVCRRLSASTQGVGDSFLYVITVKGTTGVRAELPSELSVRLNAIRALSGLPIVAVFGIASRAQGEALVKGHADGFVIGSAIVRALGEKHSKEKKR